MKAKTPKEKRIEKVKKEVISLLKKNKTIVETAKKAKVARTTIYYWIRNRKIKI